MKMVGGVGFEPTHPVGTRFTVWGTSPTVPPTIMSTGYNVARLIVLSGNTRGKLDVRYALNTFFAVSGNISINTTHITTCAKAEGKTNCGNKNNKTIKHNKFLSCAELYAI